MAVELFKFTFKSKTDKRSYYSDLYLVPSVLREVINFIDSYSKVEVQEVKQLVYFNPTVKKRISPDNSDVKCIVRLYYQGVHIVPTQYFPEISKSKVMELKRKIPIWTGGGDLKSFIYDL